MVFCLEVNWEDLWNVRCQRVFPVSLISTPLFLTSLITLTKVLQFTVHNGLQSGPTMAEEREKLRKKCGKLNSWIFQLYHLLPSNLLSNVLFGVAIWKLEQNSKDGYSLKWPALIRKPSTGVLLLLHEWSPPPVSTSAHMLKEAIKAQCIPYMLKLPPLICPYSPTIKAKNSKIKETN